MRDIGRGMTATVRNRVRQIQTDCHQHDICLTELWTLFPKRQARTAELCLSPFLIGESCKALLVQVIQPLPDAGSTTLHSTNALMHTSAMISLYDECYRLIYCNPAARDTLSSRWTTLSQRFVNESDIDMIDETLEDSDCCTVELEVNTLAGPRWHKMHIQRTVNAVNGNPCTLVSATDATERRYAQQVAYRLAYTDSLTGLPNRAALTNYLDELLDSDADTQPEFGLFFLDLDRFKAINDLMGHTVGDQLLIEVAQRLKCSVGSNGLVSRIGGDEFVLVINKVTDSDSLSRIARKILYAMTDPVVLNEQKMRVLPSIGICRFPLDGVRISELMEHADAAMYLAKSQKSGYCFFDRKMSFSMSESVKDRLELENDLIFAVRNNEFELYFQPKVACRDRSITGVEALIRWNHPTRGIVSPDKFITIAEETGQILELGTWVLEAAMRQQRRWYEAGLHVPVAINISAHQFHGDDLLMNVSECLLKTACDPCMIELEITESMLLGDAEQIHQTLHQMSSMGIRLALDDFGTGYSNLAYLQKYPLDTLKIDRAFLADQGRSMLMGTILDMGRVLGLTVVAEGVETAAQADWLTSRNCDQMQGYYFSRPLPLSEITAFLKRESGSSRDHGEVQDKAA